jgi:serine/threonine protein kinase
VQAEHFPQPGQLVGGKYRMLRELGRGAMGAVFEAEHVATGKHVAVKWLHPHVMESKSAVERLVREAQASARVRHSNVVDVYDVERDGDALFLVMEYLEGEPFASLLDRGGAPFHKVLELIVQAMRGVAEAHRQGVVHRDIKPDNIFLSYQNDRPEPIAKVLDFGISKLDAPGGLSLTQTGSALGTPLYMSYEQLSGSRDVDQRSDIYAFGVILYETLTGTLPYTADNFAELAAKVITTEPVTPRELRPDIPEHLEQVVLWAMRKRREERPPNLGVLIEALLPYTVVPEGRPSVAMRSTSSVPPGSASQARSAGGSGQRPAGASYSSPPRPGSASSPPGAVSRSASGAPALRLDPPQADWNAAIDRSQRSRREMEDRVTALVAGTMHEYPVRKSSKGRGLWMALGALATLAVGGGLFTYLLQEPTATRPSPTAPVVAAPASQPSAQEPTPPAPAPAPAATATAEPAPDVSPAPELPAAAPTQVEPVQMDNPSAQQAREEAAVAQPTPEVQGREMPPRGGRGPKQSLPRQQPRTTRVSNDVSANWQPSGATYPNVYVPPPAPVEPAPAPEPAPEPIKPKPETIEVPGTAPNPFADGEEAPKVDDATKYRAGKPSEEEF